MLVFFSFTLPLYSVLTFPFGLLFLFYKTFLFGNFNKYTLNAKYLSIPLISYLLYFFWRCVSSLFSESSSYYHLIRVFIPLVVIFLFCFLPKSKYESKSLQFSYFFITIVLLADALFPLSLSSLYTNSSPQRLSFYSDPNVFGLSFVLLSAFVLAAYIDKKNNFIYALIFLICLYVVIKSASLAALVNFLALFVAMFLFVFNLKSAILIFSIFISLVGILIYSDVYIYSKAYANFSYLLGISNSFQTGVSTTAWSRVDGIVSVFNDTVPVFGYGINSSAGLENKPHSWPVLVYYEGGLISAALGLVFVVSAVGSLLIASRRMATPASKLIGLVSSSTFLLNSFGQPQNTDLFAFMVLGFGIHFIFSECHRAK